MFAPVVCRSLIRCLSVSPRVHTGQHCPAAGDGGGQAQYQSTQQQGEEALAGSFSLESTSLCTFALDGRVMSGAWRAEVPVKVTFSLDVKGAEAAADGPRYQSEVDILISQRDSLCTTAQLGVAESTI